jgi:hypothetical protein
MIVSMPAREVHFYLSFQDDLQKRKSHASPLRPFQYILLHLFPPTNFANEHLFPLQELQTPIRPTHPAEL